MNGLSSQEKRILQWSLSARAATTLLMLVTSRFVSPFDDSAKVLLYSGQSASGWLADLALPFLQWDTLHFLAIAKEGYSIEQQHAFQPGNPLLLRLGGQIPIHLGIRSEWSASVAVVGVSALAFAASTFAPIFLYRCVLAQSVSDSDHVLMPSQQAFPRFDWRCEVLTAICPFILSLSCTGGPQRALYRAFLRFGSICRHAWRCKASVPSERTMLCDRHGLQVNWHFECWLLTLVHGVEGDESSYGTA